MKLKHACEDGGQYGLNISPEEYSEDGIRLIRTSDITPGGLLDNEEGVFVPGPIEAKYVVKENDILLSRAGTIGRSFLVPRGGAESTFAGFLVRFRPRRDTDPRFLQYALQSLPVQEAIRRDAISSTIQNFNADRYANLDLPDHGSVDQRRIADFLDDRVARIDRIIAARHAQRALLRESGVRASFDALRGSQESGPRRDSGLDWLDNIPECWPVLTVGSEFSVELGKMLDEKRQTGSHPVPYLRNTNVQWDRIELDDLKSMDIGPQELDRFTVSPGDLLVCEGGQPGRAAIYAGADHILGFQKALHRARSRGRSRPAWLLECLRVAVARNVFAVTSGTTTIAHLTNEQLRGQRFPFPETHVQDRLLSGLAESRRAATRASEGIGQSISLLAEYKSSLITAAVTGELDVTTAGSGIPG